MERIWNWGCIFRIYIDVKDEVLEVIEEIIKKRKIYGKDKGNEENIWSVV